MRPLFWFAFAVAVLSLQIACTTRSTPPDATGRSPSSAPPASISGPETASSAVPAGQRALVLPTLDHEPVLGVLIAEAPALSFTLLASGQAEGLGTLAAGEHRVAAGPQGLLLVDGRPAGRQLAIAVAARSGGRFSATALPPGGAGGKILRLDGEPLLVANGALVQLVERIGLEGYLAGVVGTEMSPTWPLEALKAQAVAARSYAAARWTQRASRPWQLHWHYTVDMAYAGAGAPSSATLAAALATTRGQVLTRGGWPLPALFHASSGGATEEAAAVFAITMPDGGAIAGAMPSVVDPACEGGCSGLRQRSTHWRWKANVPLATITRELQEWTRGEPGKRPAFGAVTGIKPASRTAAGRVATVAVEHRLKGRLRTDTIAAMDFRLAVSPIKVPSTWWDSCQVVAAKGGTLVLQGRGFGHGVGLSQVSAWGMARDGATVQTILARFYPGDALERRY